MGLHFFKFYSSCLIVRIILSMNRPQEIAQLKVWRRSLHQIPELGLELPLTQKYLIEQLQDLDCEISRPLEYSVAAFFDNHKEKTIAFRSDMDALPVIEQTGCEFKSLHEGCMHACGHDGHMSTMLLFAHRLQEFYKELSCNVLLIFQPGEENPGGAAPILKTGIFKEKNVVAVFGMHLWPVLDKGKIATISGPMMASAREVNVNIYGKAVHAARYFTGIDAMKTGVKYLQRCYDLEGALPREVNRLLHFGFMEAGRIRNVVANHCLIQGTMRAFDDPTITYLYDGVEQAAKDLAEETGARIEVDWSDGYPPVTNDPALVQRILDETDLEISLLDEPVMIAEDFAYYQKEVPGVFFFLGTGTGIELHDSHFNFDEEILIAGADLFEQIAHLEFK